MSVCVVPPLLRDNLQVCGIETDTLTNLPPPTSLSCWQQEQILYSDILEFFNEAIEPTDVGLTLGFH